MANINIKIQKVLSIALFDKIKVNKYPKEYLDEIDFSKLIKERGEKQTLFIYLDTVEKDNRGIKSEIVKKMYNSLRKNTKNAFGIRAFSIIKTTSDDEILKLCKEDVEDLKMKIETGINVNQIMVPYKEIKIYTTPFIDEKNKEPVLVDMSFFRSSYNNKPKIGLMKKISSILFDVKSYVDSNTKFKTTPSDRSPKNIKITIDEKPYIPYYFRDKKEVSNNTLDIKKSTDIKLREDVFQEYKREILNIKEEKLEDKLKNMFYNLKISVDVLEDEVKSPESNKKEEQIIIKFRDRILLTYNNLDKLEGVVSNITPEGVYEVSLKDDTKKMISLLEKNEFKDHSLNENICGKYRKITDEYKKKEKEKEKAIKKGYKITNSFPKINGDKLYFYPNLLINEKQIKDSNIYENKNLSPKEIVEVFTDINKLQKVTSYVFKKDNKKYPMKEMTLSEKEEASTQFSKFIAEYLFKKNDLYYDNLNQQYFVIEYDVDGIARGENKEFSINIKLYITKNKDYKKELKKVKCKKGKSEIKGLLKLFLNSTPLFSSLKSIKGGKKKSKKKKKLFKINKTRKFKKKTRKNKI